MPLGVQVPQIGKRFRTTIFGHLDQFDLSPNVSCFMDFCFVTITEGTYVLAVLRDLHRAFVNEVHRSSVGNPPHTWGPQRSVQIPILVFGGDGLADHVRES